MDRTAEQVKLKKKIRSEWSSIMKSDPDLIPIIKKINEGKATYEEVEELSYRVGKDLGKSLLANLEPTIPAGAKVPDDIYEVILGPVLKEGHGAVIEAAKKVQEEMNKRAGIGLKAQTADFDEDRAKGLAEKLKSGIFEDTKWVLDEPVALFHQSSADRTLKKNVKFQARAGLHPKITRKATGGCCKWCQALAGIYDYGDEPNDIYRRHQRCQCVVDFKPGDGKRQNVWSKEWHEDTEPEKVEARKKTEKEYVEEKTKAEQKRIDSHGKNGTIKDIEITVDAKGYAEDNFDRKTSPMSRDEDLKAVNPNYSKGKKSGYQTNCQRCVPTYLLRLQGFDVVANPDNFGHDSNIEFLLHRHHRLKYVGDNGKHPEVHFAKGTGKAEIEEFMKELREGAMCEIACSWDPKKVDGGGGHVFIAVKENGIIKFKDPQTGDEDVSRYFDLVIKGRTDYIRIDDTKVAERFIWYIARNNR